MGNKIGFLTGLTIFLLFAVPMFLEIQKTQVTASSIQQLAQEVVILTETEGGLSSRVNDLIAKNEAHYAKTKMDLDVSVSESSGSALASKAQPSTEFEVNVSVSYSAWFKENTMTSSASGIIMKR